MRMRISVRQICFIMLIYTAVSKFIIYPTFLSFQSGRDLLFSAAFDFALQAVVVWAVSYLCSRTDRTFFQLISGTLGHITARIVYALFALFFMLCTVLPLFEQNAYVHSIFYDTVPSILVFLPIFFFTVYAAGKSFQNIGRSADICMPIFIVSIIFIFAMCFAEVKWDSFLPVLRTPFKDVIGGSVASLFRFMEPCWLLMFMGHFTYKKGDAAKITLSYIGGAVIVLLVLAAFYGVYGDITTSRQFAISKISLFFPAIDVIGRIDLIALYALEVVMLFALVLNVQLAVHCINECTGYDNKAVISLAVNAVLALILILFNNELDAIHTLWSRWMWIAFVIFATVIPLLAWALKRREKDD